MNEESGEGGEDSSLISYITIRVVQLVAFFKAWEGDLSYHRSSLSAFHGRDATILRREEL